MKRIYLLVSLVLLLVSLGSFTDDKPAKEKEISYKTGKAEPRYLSGFNEQAIQLPEDYSAFIDSIEDKKEKILELLNAAGKSATQFDWFNTIEDEHVFFTISDLGNARFTLKVDKGEFSVQEGIDLS